jgi:hypothetical protein
VRRKRYERNIGLLEWDRAVNPDRNLGKMLEVRDRLQAARYIMEMNGGQLTNEVVALCQRAISVFQTECLDSTEVDVLEGLKYYSGALELLGNQGIQATFALDVHKNGANRHPGLSTYRFANKDDFKKFMMAQIDQKCRLWDTKYV